MSTGRRFTLDGSMRRVGNGRVLLGGSPLRLFRLAPGGVDVLDRIAAGGAVGATPAERALLDRLLDAGVIHPLFDRDPDPAGRDVSRVTVVIPAFGVEAADLGHLVACCAGTSAVLIVDDGSPVPISAVSGATVLTHRTNLGPAAARMTGAAHATTAVVAFVDGDVILHDGWLAPLLAHFTDERVALVAPRVASEPGPSTLARYEVAHSPLDLGTSPARVRAGSRVSYVPAAVMLVRRDALDAVGGFCADLRVGEDVDLVWRLDEAGWWVRYEPAGAVAHRPRASLAAWARQRVDYGSSSAPLEARHPGSLAPLRISVWSATSWVCIAIGRPGVGLVIAAVTTAQLARRLRGVPGGPLLALRLAGLGHLFAGRSLAGAVTRAWWPISIVLAASSRRARRAVALALLVPAGYDWVRRRPAVEPVTYLALRTLDDLCAGAGLWAGAARARSHRALLPDLTSWPRTRRSAPTPRTA